MIYCNILWYIFQPVFDYFCCEWDNYVNNRDSPPGKQGTDGNDFDLKIWRWKVYSFSTIIIIITMIIIIIIHSLCWCYSKHINTCRIIIKTPQYMIKPPSTYHPNTLVHHQNMSIYIIKTMNISSKHQYISKIL